MGLLSARRRPSPAIEAPAGKPRAHRASKMTATISHNAEPRTLRRLLQQGQRDMGKRAIVPVALSLSRFDSTQKSIPTAYGQDPFRFHTLLAHCRADEGQASRQVGT